MLAQWQGGELRRDLGHQLFEIVREILGEGLRDGGLDFGIIGDGDEQIEALAVGLAGDFEIFEIHALAAGFVARGAGEPEGAARLDEAAG